jgi:ribonuclease HII
MARLEELPIAEIRKRYLEGREPLSQQTLNRLERDSREGVRKLCVSLRRRFEHDRDERVRLDAMRHFERVLWKSGIRDIAGVDEAGMAPLAGPVVAAAVMFPPDTEIAGVDDSKRLDPPTRERLAAEIRAKASGVSVGIATVAEIDDINIYHAGLLAMRRAVEGLPRPPQHLLVDARTVPGVSVPQNPFNKGDGINFSIAAASIIAKTERDRMMVELDARYPGYGFAAHKGYPVPEHRECLLKLGRSPVHRLSFPVLREWFGEYCKDFYDLRTSLFEAETRDALATFEKRLKDTADLLSESEYGKLRLLYGRRWKAVA